ncbi:MAG: sulfite exporter TauE/SafE family protein [Clostridiales bacterium]|nr:sulfite exporter TauE/SafE family protein [Clostridiales bacterium]
MNLVYNILAALFSGIAGAMGLGGGGVLVLYLTLILNEKQLTSQGINLLFFLPCAALSVIIHTRKRLIKWRELLPIIIGGVLGVALGAWLAFYVATDILGKLFGGFLLLIGLKELFSKKKPKATDEK